ncbi:MAG TPA: M20/M25/M40 family metallo-hydrolase [Chloroflexota bacterium]|jgi:acetylornithine deacetylase/succinyl-diaminopimelate desuccinylase-like protein
MNEQEIAALIDRYLDADYLTAILVRLLQTPTDVPLGQTELAPEDPKLARYVREVVQPELERFGFDRILVDASNNLICRVGADLPTPSLLLMGYAVAQHANLMTNPYSGRIASGRDYGLDEPCAFGQAATQHKGALAAALGALKLLADSGARLRGQLIFAVNTEGRSSHANSAEIIDGHGVRADQGILAFATENRISLGNRGRVDVNVTIEGKAAHSSQPWLGLSAIDGSYEALTRLRAVQFAQAHPQLGAAQATVYKLQFSPIAPHTLPATAQMTVDRRLLPGEDVAAAVDGVRAALGDLSPYGLTVDQGAFMYPAAVPPDAPVVQALQAAGRATLGRAIETFYLPNTFDAGYANHVGIPTVMFGPGVRRLGSGVMDEDLVALAAVRDAARVYAHTLFSLLT